MTWSASGQEQKLAERTRASLRRTADAEMTITYQGLATMLALSPPNTIHQITTALERLMQQDAQAGRPFIAAIAISKVRNGLPAAGFFECAKRLGRFEGDVDGPEARFFHASELKAAFKYWGRFSGVASSEVR